MPEQCIQNQWKKKKKKKQEAGISFVNFKRFLLEINKSLIELFSFIEIIRYVKRLIHETRRVRARASTRRTSGP